MVKSKNLKNLALLYFFKNSIQIFKRIILYRFFFLVHMATLAEKLSIFLANFYYYNNIFLHPYQRKLYIDNQRTNIDTLCSL